MVMGVRKDKATVCTEPIKPTVQPSFIKSDTRLRMNMQLLHMTALASMKAVTDERHAIWLYGHPRHEWCDVHTGTCDSGVKSKGRAGDRPVMGAPTAAGGGRSCGGLSTGRRLSSVC